MFCINRYQMVALGQGWAGSTRAGGLVDPA